MKINNFVLAFSTLIIIIGCSNNLKNKQTDNQKNEIKSTNIQTDKNELVVNDSSYILNTRIPFKYKELFENYQDSMGKLDEDCQDSIRKIGTTAFLGSWTISQISSVGGTMKKEAIIRNQIGNKLIFSKDKIIFNFLNEKYEINNPESYIETIDLKNTTEDIRGTTYNFGYRDKRKKINSLVIKNVGYFEIISYVEIAIYYDGRIYFLKRD